MGAGSSSYARSGGLESGALADPGGAPCQVRVPNPWQVCPALRVAVVVVGSRVTAVGSGAHRIARRELVADVRLLCGGGLDQLRRARTGAVRGDPVDHVVPALAPGRVVEALVVGGGADRLGERVLTDGLLEAEVGVLGEDRAEVGVDLGGGGGEAVGQ